MAVNCNTIVPLDAHMLDKKAALGRSVSVAVHAALSNCYRAIEALEVSCTRTGAEVVYLQTAITKLDAAAQALCGMREILATGKPSEENIEWLQSLDFDRLYDTGSKKGLIPPFVEQWNRLVGLVKSSDHLSVTDCLIADVEALKKKIHSVINIDLSGTPDASVRETNLENLAMLQTALVEFSSFAQMVNYLNALQPLDARWCRALEQPELVGRLDDTRSLIQ